MTVSPMLNQTVTLSGFEEALAAWLEAGFCFGANPDAPAYVNFKRGRSLFVQDMPEVEEIQETTADATFDPKTEPVLALYTEPGAPWDQTVGRCPMHEWTVRLILRFMTTPEDTKRALEEVVEYVYGTARGGIMGRFSVRAAYVIFRPTIAGRETDGHVVATATMRFKVAVNPA
jgi:hypothetical protein